jgi:hypothetical protein
MRDQRVSVQFDQGGAKRLECAHVGQDSKEKGLSDGEEGEDGPVREPLLVVSVLQEEEGCEER